MNAAPSPIVAPGLIAQYDLAYQIAPIILSGGIVGVQGSYAPITSYMGSLAGQPAANGNPPTGARFVPLPGSTLVAQTIGMYPFANQSIAANATIPQPLTISMKMIAPVNTQGGYGSKLSSFTSLATTLKQHNAAGGAYIIATPAYVYTSLVFLTMTDVTSEEVEQQQILWQLDFIAPILTAAGAAAALQGTLLNTLTNGNQINGTPAYSGNPSASPANLPGVVAALSTFGGQL
jgi:hypothetical protein